MIVDRINPPVEAKKNCKKEGHPVDDDLFVWTVAAGGEWSTKLFVRMATGTIVNDLKPDPTKVYICDWCGTGFVTDYSEYMRPEYRKERRKRTKKRTTRTGPR